MIFTSFMMTLLPGFLSLMQEWLPVFGESLSVTDFWSSDSRAPIDQGLKKMGAWVNEHSGASSVLVAYSLGGRIALHSLLEGGSPWKAAILISPHTGLKTVAEKEKRMESDAVWANRFQRREAGGEEWSSLMKVWNDQSVFHSSLGASLPEPIRIESDYSRDRLASAMKACSLGTQEDLLPRLHEIQIPVLWVVGEWDLKFREIQTAALKMNPLFQAVLIEEAGHRVHVDQPAKLKKETLRFLENL